MPAWRHVYRPDSPSRILLAALENSDEPLTHFELATKANVTVSWVWKCLQRLIDDGYVKDAGNRSFRQNGTMSGRLPKLYKRTDKQLPAADCPDAPTPQELCDVMNAIIRRNVAAKRK